MRPPIPGHQQEQVIAALPVELRALARHVLLGEFNRRGDPVGFHHAPQGVCPPGRRIDEVLERFSDGSYRARVSFWDRRRGWIRKRSESTMFPDHWTSGQVMEAGLHAYRHRTEDWIERWRCGTSRPPIRGFHRRGSGPVTFYPDFRGHR